RNGLRSEGPRCDRRCCRPDSGPPTAHGHRADRWPCPCLRRPIGHRSALLPAWRNLPLICPIFVVQPVTHHIRGLLRSTRLTAPDVAVLPFGTGPLPPALRSLPVVDLESVDDCRRIVVVGTDADLASVLTRLLRNESLDAEI